MGIRELMQRNPAVAAVAAVVVILGCVVWIARGDKAGVASEQVYFYDLGAGKLFAADRTSEPPIDAPSGAGAGVKAAVFTCGACKESEYEIAFLTTFSEQAREAIKRRDAAAEGEFNVELDQIIDQGLLVAAVPADGGEPRWVPAMTPQGIAITSSTDDLCGEQPAKPCLPK